MTTGKIGSMIQLESRGKEDLKYLSSTPEITLFKTMYRRHTNFAVESIENNFDGFIGPNSKVSISIDRKGDLMHKTWIEVKNVSGDLYDMIKNVTVYIGNRKIDSHTSEWMRIVKNIKIDNEKRKILDVISKSATTSLIRIPLSFWFCNDYGNSIPLIHLNEDEVKITIEFNNVPSSALLSLWVDYVYLDLNERNDLAQNTHEYLIEQVQTTGLEYIDTVQTEIETDFNNAIKEVIWKLDDVNHDKITQAVLLLDEKQLFNPRDGGYFSHIQRYSLYSNSKYPTDKTLYMHSFAMEPNKHNQPTGTINIDGKVLTLIFTGTHGSGATCVIYAVNYNILTFKDGRAFIKYFK